MRNEKELSNLMGRLESEIELLRPKKDEASALLWREKRKELADAQYEMFEILKDTRPIIAVQLLWRSTEMGPVDPATPKMAHREGIFLYDPASRILKFSLHYEGLSGAPSMAHFH